MLTFAMNDSDDELVWRVAVARVVQRRGVYILTVALTLMDGRVALRKVSSQQALGLVCGDVGPALIPARRRPVVRTSSV